VVPLVGPEALSIVYCLGAAKQKSHQKTMIFDLDTTYFHPNSISSKYGDHHLIPMSFNKNMMRGNKITKVLTILEVELIEMQQLNAEPALPLVLPV
jgi:hypothetical protein